MSHGACLRVQAGEVRTWDIDCDSAWGKRNVCECMPFTCMLIFGSLRFSPAHLFHAYGGDARDSPLKADVAMGRAPSPLHKMTRVLSRVADAAPPQRIAGRSPGRTAQRKRVRAILGDSGQALCRSCLLCVVVCADLAGRGVARLAASTRPRGGRRPADPFVPPL